MAGTEDKKAEEPKASDSPKSLGALSALENVAKPLFDVLVFVLPLLVTGAYKAHAMFQKLPQNAIRFMIGFVFCFFGGMYPVLFAAISAAEYGGRQAVVDAVKDLSEGAMIIIEESKKDDQVDEDKDGKADVTEISGKEYMIRKTKLVLRKMDPKKFDRAIGTIYKVWLVVVAALNIQFARTISLALAIAEFMKKPVDRFIAPVVEMAVPDEYDKWVPVVLGW